VSQEENNTCINLKIQCRKQKKFVVLHRITEGLRLAGTSKDRLVQPHHTSRVKYSRLLRAMFS